MTGGGTLTLNGSNNYAGSTTVQTGNIIVGDNATLGTTSGNITIATSGNATMSTGAGSTVNANTINATGAAGNTGSFTLGSDGAATLTANQILPGPGTANASFNGTLNAISTQNNFIGSGFNTMPILNGLTINDNGFNLGINSGFNGSGNLTKTGTGTVSLNSSNTYNGTTTVNSGILAAGATNAFSPNSNHTVDSGSTLALSGFSQTIGSLNNNGTVSLNGTAPGTQLTVTGNLAGTSGSTFSILTNLAALTGDMINIQGTSSGNYNLVVTNQGGSPTTPEQALKVVSTTDGIAQFSLSGGQINAGLFIYTLQEGLNGTDPTDWFLVNTGLNPLAQNVIVAALTPSPSIWLSQFDSLYKRTGELRQLKICCGECKLPNGNVWIRNYD